MTTLFERYDLLVKWAEYHGLFIHRNQSGIFMPKITWYLSRSVARTACNDASVVFAITVAGESASQDSKYYFGHVLTVMAEFLEQWRQI